MTTLNNETLPTIEDIIQLTMNLTSPDIQDVFSLLIGNSHLLEDGAIDEIDFDGGEWTICTYEQATNRAKDYILDSVWAFNASFLSSHTGIDEDAIQAIHDNNKCEGNNKLLLRLIKDEQAFIDDAIGCDGLGHFLNSYDGEYIELGNDSNGVFWVAYRTN